MGQSRDFGTDLEALNSPGHWDCPNCTDANTMGFISQSQRPKNLGQFQDFGTVLGLWDCSRLHCPFFFPNPATELGKLHIDCVKVFIYYSQH